MYGPYPSSGSGGALFGVGNAIDDLQNRFIAQMNEQVLQKVNYKSLNREQRKRVDDALLDFAKTVRAHGHGPSLGDIVKALTAPITAPVEAIAKITEKIPVLGDITGIVSDAASSPAKLAIAIASGARIDKAVMAHFKDQLKLVKDIAPYAQTIVSFVPGIGTGVAAAIAAGAALAEGKSIDEIAKAAVRGAIPGGPIVAAGFDAALKIASGKNVAQSVLEGARSALPPAAQSAFDVGMAVVTGENIQNAITNGLMNLGASQLGSIAAIGKKAIGSSPALANVLNSLPTAPAKEGFQLASGLLSQTGINSKALAAVRSKLAPEIMKGFDTALKTQEAATPWVLEVMAPQLGTTQSLIEKAAAKAAAERQAPAMREAPKPAAKAPAMREAPKPVTKGGTQATTPQAAKVAAAADQLMTTARGPASSITRVYPPYPRAL